MGLMTMKITRAEALQMAADYRAAYIEPYKASSDYYTFSDLWKERGWPKRLIGELLGGPDETLPNPHHKTGPHPMRLYTKVRVHAAEQDPRFVEHQTRRQKRLKTGSEVGERKGLEISKSLELGSSNAPSSRPTEATVRDEVLEGFEGAAKRRFVLHRRREAGLRRKKLQEALRRNDGRLVCEVPNCEFDFAERYGVLGVGYAQIHHKELLSEAPKEGRKVTLDDLAVVCANCHVMIHIGGECRPLEGLISPKHERQSPASAAGAGHPP